MKEHKEKLIHNVLHHSWIFLSDLCEWWGDEEMRGIEGGGGKGYEEANFFVWIAPSF